jgi:hypothetical protein
MLQIKKKISGKKRDSPDQASNTKNSQFPSQHIRTKEEIARTFKEDEKA